VLLCSAALAGLASSASAATFDPELVISNDNMRAANSMSEAQVQAFLDVQPGVLKSLVTTDYAGAEGKKASKIIWQACQAWQISPKVMLTMLQKEQSLLTRTTLDKNTLSRAIGAGCPDAHTNRYPGFGQQMWNGARMLSSYGEGNPSFPTYYEGIGKTIYKDAKYGTTLHPKNLATFKLYVYNPSIPGNTNFWTIYRRYFGSTFANPRMRAVYKFRKYSNGTYLYTTSLAERYRLHYTAERKHWDYYGPKFSVDTSVTSTSTVPVYRFKNKLSRKYSFTTSQAKYTARRTTTGRRIWDYQGVAFRVSRTETPGAVTVYRFRNRHTGAYWFTTSAAAVKYYQEHASYRRKWDFEGVAYYLPRLQVPPSTPATPTP
jgi:hypothetical protein